MSSARRVVARRSSWVQRGLSIVPAVVDTTRACHLLPTSIAGSYAARPYPFARYAP